jgi:hypothetical protein
LSSGGVLAAKCTVDISKFPFDSQTCKLQFTVWNTYASDVMLYTDTSDPFSLDFYTHHSDWSLQSHSAEAYVWNNFSVESVHFSIAFSMVKCGNHYIHKHYDTTDCYCNHHHD